MMHDQLEPGSNRTDQMQIQDHAKSEGQSRARSGSIIGGRRNFAQNAGHFLFRHKQLETHPFVGQEQAFCCIDHSD